MNINQYVVSGNLCKQPELKYSGGGAEYCNINLASNEKYTDKNGNEVNNVLFIEGVVFGNSAKWVSKYQKGERVIVTGKLQLSTWQDQKSGENRSKISMVVNSVLPINYREGYFDDNNNQNNNQNNQQNNNQQNNNQQNNNYQNNNQQNNNYQDNQQNNSQPKSRGGFNKFNNNNNQPLPPNSDWKPPQNEIPF